MQQESKHRWLRAPSPAMIVALIALVFAMSGTAVAASKLISGDKIIKIGSLSGNRLRNGTVTGTQINVAKLGKVPSAAQADSATSATHATSADTATNATHATSADSATNATHATAAGSAAPSGAAGGDLSGSYPNPTIAAGAVGTTKLGPMPGACVGRSTNQSMANGWDTLSFDTVEYNVGGVWNAATPDLLTAPVDGTYLVVLSACWAANASGIREVIITVGGTAIAFDATAAYSDSGYGPWQNVERVIKLKAGTVVHAQTYQDSSSGGNLGIYGFLVGGSAKTPMFEMQWIAPY